MSAWWKLLVRPRNLAPTVGVVLLGVQTGLSIVGRPVSAALVTGACSLLLAPFAVKVGDKVRESE